MPRKEANPLAALERVNEAFYKAFEALDIAAMDRVWAPTDYAACVHPGQELVVGWPAVRESFEAVFRGTGQIRFSLAEQRLLTRGDLAWISLVENVHHGDDVRVAVQATNLFERSREGWRMILHHASPISDDAGEPDTDFLQ